MVDKLVEDIIEVTETLMEADAVDIEALAHPQTKPTLNERAGHGKHHKWKGLGKWRKHKAHELKAKIAEHQQGDGVFKRGAC
jgi:hypothetical protein